MISSMSSKFSSEASIFDTPIVPKTNRQWKSALHGIKQLYLQRQYKQCAGRSAELLKGSTNSTDPVYLTYLHFYIAIANEVLGRAAHRYSSNKLSFLHLSLESFVKCGDVLPSKAAIPRITEVSKSAIPRIVEESTPSPISFRDFSTPSDFSEGDSILSSITRIIDNSLENPEDDPFVSDTESCDDFVSFGLPLHDLEKPPPMPSPLQIRKTSSAYHSGSPISGEDQFVTEAPARPSQVGRGPRPPPLPLKIIPVKKREACTAREDCQVNAENLSDLTSRISAMVIDQEKETEHFTPSQAQKIMRYNSSIDSLRSQIDSGISGTRSLINEVTKLQQTRQMSKNIRRSGSFWSFSPVKDDSSNDSSNNGNSNNLDQRAKETKEQRIARLRQEGWKTVGIRSPLREWKGLEYYQAFCRAVLDELYK